MRRRRVRFVFIAPFVLGSLALASCPTPSNGNDAPALKSLTVRTTEGWGGELVPRFSKAVRDYSVVVAGDCIGVQISAASRASDQTVSIDGKEIASGGSVVVSPPVGSSRVAIEVRNGAGGSVAYSISIDREDLRPTARKFLRLRYDDPATGISMVYRLFVPEGYDPAAKTHYPLVLYLHGAGELDTDDDALLVGNQGPAVWARPEEQAVRPCFVLAPHCHRTTGGSGSDAPLGWTFLMKYGPNPGGGRTPFDATPLLSVAFKILQKVELEYPVDTERIYLTGLSMGGFGAWTMATEHPEIFAALVPIAGGGDPAKLSRIAKLPVWAFHGADDGTVPVHVSRDTVAALKATGGKPKYTEYPKGTFFIPNAHFSWVPAYANEAMRKWLFKQSLRHRAYGRTISVPNTDEISAAAAMMRSRYSFLRSSSKRKVGHETLMAATALPE